MPRAATWKSPRGEAATEQVDGFLNVCKPLGWTSHDVVGFVRRLTGQQRVGHAGTLDPAASGVLPVCLGRATRLADRVAAGSKLYAADVVLGTATETCDAEGRLLDSNAGATSFHPPALEALTAALAGLVGAIGQVPPSYSARKIGGVAAYVRARRGEEVTLASRDVTVYGLGLLAASAERVSILVRCSKGTYVRALARDLGGALGLPAHLDALIRLQVGSFSLADAITVEHLERAAAGDWRAEVEPPDRVLCELPAALLGGQRVTDYGHGRAWDLAGAEPLEARAYDEDGRFLGLLRPDDAIRRWQPALSFVYDASAAPRR